MDGRGGGGIPTPFPRVCLGDTFATVEAKLFTSMLFCALVPTPDQILEPLATGTVRPSVSVQVEVGCR